MKITLELPLWFLYAACIFLIIYSVLSIYNTYLRWKLNKLTSHREQLITYDKWCETLSIEDSKLTGKELVEKYLKLK